jgi:diguanylate cyclase (GGDEF)-like protein
VLRRGAIVDEDQWRGGWLCPTRADRLRLVEMNQSVRRARILVGLLCGIGVAAMTPWFPTWTLALFAMAPGPLLILDRLLARSRRPERLIAGSLVLHTTLILCGVAVTGGVHSPVLPWVAIPVVTAAARFRLRVFLIGAMLAFVGLLAAVALGSPSAAEQDPAPLIGMTVLLASLVVVQQPLLAAEIRWREDAVLDPLTGLLNRQGLHRRFREVAEQARLTQRPVALVLFDLDRFKDLNDTHGHARGDAVLKDVAYVLRKELRTFELLYRIGGEELLLVLPGAELASACHVAETARGAIESARPGGLPVTASFGVCSSTGPGVEFDTMFQSADMALYEAKRSGRNRVAYGATPDVAPTVIAAT